MKLYSAIVLTLKLFLPKKHYNMYIMDKLSKIGFPLNKNDGHNKKL